MGTGHRCASDFRKIPDDDGLGRSKMQSEVPWLGSPLLVAHV